MSAAKKGFASMYGIILLYMLLTFLDMFMVKLTLQNKAKEQYAVCEIQAIHQVKQDLKNQMLQDRQWKEGECTITLTVYDGYCKIEVHYQNKDFFISELHYDQATKKLIAYEYIT